MVFMYFAGAVIYQVIYCNQETIKKRHGPVLKLIAYRFQELESDSILFSFDSTILAVMVVFNITRESKVLFIFGVMSVRDVLMVSLKYRALGNYGSEPL